MIRGLLAAALLSMLPAGVAGCTSLLGVDGDYRLALDDGGTSVAGRKGTGGEASGDGGRGAGGVTAGGQPGAGGTLATGGVDGGGPVDSGDAATSSGGAAPTGCEATGCQAGKKCCPEISRACLAAGPIIGCASDSCDPCAPPPPQGIAICVDGQCALKCNDDFVQEGAECVQVAAGGAPGAGGGASSGGAPAAGGQPAACSASTCTNKCNIAGPARCCKNDGNCGCTWGLGCY